MARIDPTPLILDQIVKAATDKNLSLDGKVTIICSLADAADAVNGGSEDDLLSTVADFEDYVSDLEELTKEKRSRAYFNRLKKILRTEDK